MPSSSNKPVTLVIVVSEVDQEQKKCVKINNGDFDGTGSTGKHKKVMEAEAEELLYEGQSLQLQ